MNCHCMINFESLFLPPCLLFAIMDCFFAKNIPSMTSNRALLNYLSQCHCVCLALCSSGLLLSVIIIQHKQRIYAVLYIKTCFESTYSSNLEDLFIAFILCNLEEDALDSQGL